MNKHEFDGGLKESEQQVCFLTRFANASLDGRLLRAYLEGAWLPWDINDWGVVSHYTLYFGPENITARILVEPPINDHHVDALPRSVPHLSFSQGRIGSLAQTDGLLHLGAVPDRILDPILSKLSRLHKQSDC